MVKEFVVPVDAEAYAYFEDVMKQEAARKDVTTREGFPLDHPALRIMWAFWQAIEKNTDYERVVVVPGEVVKD